MPRPRRWYDTAARYAVGLTAGVLGVIALTDSWKALVVAVVLVNLGAAIGAAGALSTHDADGRGHDGWCWNQAVRGPQRIDRRGCSR
jgi:hypothetical protein